MASELKRTVRQQLGTEKASVAMAITILTDRVRRLSKEDSEDAFELLQCLWRAETDDEREAADDAIWELLSQESVTVHEQRLPSPDEEDVTSADCADFAKWKSFVAAKIREARAAVNMTQDQLAESSGLPQSHISRIENGHLSPSHITLEKIAAALGVPVGDFDPSA